MNANRVIRAYFIGAGSAVIGIISSIIFNFLIAVIFLIVGPYYVYEMEQLIGVYLILLVATPITALICAFGGVISGSIALFLPKKVWIVIATFSAIGEAILIILICGGLWYSFYQEVF